MADPIPETGIKLVAQGADEFNATFQQVVKDYDQATKAQLEFINAASQAGQSFTEIEKALQAQGSSWTQANAAITQYDAILANIKASTDATAESIINSAKVIDTTTVAIKESAKAFNERAVASKVAADSIESDEERINRIVEESMARRAARGTGRTTGFGFDQSDVENTGAAAEATAAFTASINGLTEAELSEAEAARIVAETHARITQTYTDQAKQVQLLSGEQSNFFAEARAGRIAVAALNVELALMTVAAGETLPQGLREAARALQVVADTTFAFAFAGSAIPGIGTAVGAVIGLLVGSLTAFVTVANAVDPAITDVNKKLDELAKKNDVAETLSKITGQTRALTDEELKLAQESPQVAKALKDLADQAEHTRSTFDVLGDVIQHSFDSHILDGFKFFEDAIKNLGTNLTYVTTLWLAIADADRAYIDTLQKTGDVVQANQAKLKTFEDDIVGNTKALLDNADANLKNAVAAQQRADAADAILKQYDAEATKLSNQKDLLVDLTGITKDQSQTLTTYTQAHQDAADAIATTLHQLGELKAQQEDLGHSDKGLNEDIAETTQRLHEMANADLIAAEAEKQLAELTKQLDGALKSYSDALETANQKLSQLNTKTQQQFDQAAQQLQDAQDNATRTRSEADANAEQQHSDRLSDIYLARSDKLADIELQFNERIAQIDQQRTDREADIETELNNRLSDIATQLADRIFQIQQGLSNKLQGLARQYRQQIQQDNEKEAQDAQALADKLLQIEQQRIEATAALDFNTAERLRSAKTDHDRDAILRQHAFEQGQIDQRANDSKKQAEDEFTKQIEQLEKQKQLERENYEYAVEQAKKLAEQQIEEARRSAAEQAAIAQRNAAQQIAIAERTAQEQAALAKQQEQDAIALAQRQYAEQRAVADRTRTEQLAKDRQAEQDKLDDAARAYAERTKAIEQSYAAERLQIEITLAKARQAYEEMVTLFANLFQISRGFAEQLLNLARLENQIAGFRNGNPIGEGNFGTPNQQTPAPQTPSPVPAGTGSQQSIPAPSAPQGVTVSPHSTTNNSSNQSVHIAINGVTDPIRVGQIVREQLDLATRGY